MEVEKRAVCLHSKRWGCPVDGFQERSRGLPNKFRNQTISDLEATIRAKELAPTFVVREGSQVELEDSDTLSELCPATSRGNGYEDFYGWRETAFEIADTVV